MSKVSQIRSMAERYNIVFAEFPDHRYHVYRAEWNHPTAIFLGLVIKEFGVWRFMSDAASVKIYYGVTRCDAVCAYLLDHPLNDKEF